MTKRTLVLLLWILAVITIGYAIYRSTGEKIIMMESGRQVIYGEPQHGLILGLCIFAGFCIIGSVPLLLDRKAWEKDADTISKRTL